MNVVTLFAKMKQIKIKTTFVQIVLGMTNIRRTVVVAKTTEIINLLDARHVQLFTASLTEFSSLLNGLAFNRRWWNTTEVGLGG